jgi:hypothetical protein
LNGEKENNELSDDSDISHESFKNSRNSKMSNRRSSGNSNNVGVLSVFKKTENLISIKEMLPTERDRGKSINSLLPLSSRFRRHFHNTM